MRAIRLSFFQMLTCMRRDLMLFAACLAPILAGLLFRFAIPFIEAALTDWLCRPSVLSPYYALIDLCFAMLSPAMFCFVSAMVALEEADEKTAAYLFVTPLGKNGYLAARLLVPSAAAFLITLVLLPLFKLTALSPLPAFWIGKAVLEHTPLFMLPAFVLSAVWIFGLLKRYL